MHVDIPSAQWRLTQMRITSSLNAILRATAPESGSTQDTAPAKAENAVLAPLYDEAKVKKIRGAMSERELFPTLAAALAKLEAVGTKIESADYFGIPVGIKGLDQETGEIDESIYTGQRAALAFVGSKTKEASGIKGIVIFPVPTVEQFMESDNGKAFMDKIAAKECALVAFRSFRESSTLYEFMSGVNAAPANAAEYATESKRGIDTDTFDLLWPGFRKSLGEKMEAIAALLPPKKQFLDALRSKAYAESNDDTKALEAKGLFVKLGQSIIKAGKAAQPEALDTSAIEEWIAQRETLILTRDGGKPKDFSILDKMGDALDF